MQLKPACAKQTRDPHSPQPVKKVAKESALLEQPQKTARARPFAHLGVHPYSEEEPDVTGSDGEDARSPQPIPQGIKWSPITAKFQDSPYKSPSTRIGGKPTSEVQPADLERHEGRAHCDASSPKREPGSPVLRVRSASENRPLWNEPGDQGAEEITPSSGSGPSGTRAEEGGTRGAPGDCHWGLPQHEEESPTSAPRRY